MHTVKQGDCIESLAAEHGHLPRTLWDHQRNASLRERRKDQNVLLPGDIVFIPEVRQRRETATTGRSHRYQMAQPKTLLSLIFEDENGKPRDGIPYELRVEGKGYTGTTGADGKVERPISARARVAELTLHPQPDEQEVYELRLGHLDPPDEVSGAQARLANLGYYGGHIDGALGPVTCAALQAFQEENAVPITGKLDAATSQTLKSKHRD